MPQTLVNIRMDTALKQDMEAVCRDLGMNMTTAFTIFAKKMSRERRIPFDVSVLVNGKTALDVQFYVLEGNKGELYLKKTKISAEKLYNSEGKVYLGKLILKRGRTEIVISATDISQNTTRITYPLQVE